MEKDQKNDLEKDTLIKRIRFKPLLYDVESQYDRLQERLLMPDVPFRKSIATGWRWVAVAASVALLIVSTLFVVHLQPKEMVWYETIAVSDAKTKVVLPDSSAVWLNANAYLRYPRSFDEKIRKVDVSGEVFFQVRKDKKPFIVDLGKLHIKVLGTSFNVVTDAQNDAIIVTLLEGKIALYDKDHPKETERILTPNNQAIYYTSEGNIHILPVRPESITSWVTGQFRFENTTLAEIVTELERAFHVKIHIENEAMRQKTFNAVFEDKETLDEILSILQISARYTIEKNRGEIYLR